MGGIKKLTILLLVVCVLAAGVYALGGDTAHAQVIPMESAVFTDREINAGIRAAKLYFKLRFSGCTLTEIGYAGDWAGMDGKSMILTSSFHTDEHGGSEGTFSPNETYTGWSWTLKRLPGGLWYHVDHGYG